MSIFLDNLLVFSDIFGITIGVLSILFLTWCIRHGPEAQQLPLRYMMTGLVCIVIAFGLSLSVSLVQFNDKPIEAIHHIFMAIGVCLFVISAWHFLKFGR